MDFTQEKESLRKTMRRMRAEVDPTWKLEADAAICARLLSRCEIASVESPIAIYLASPREINLLQLIERLLERGRTIVAPRWNGKTYEMARLNGLDEKDLRQGPMGILEPAEAEIVPPKRIRTWIVPGLAFTHDGKRLGYGGGWYDRLLSATPPDAVKIGVAYPFQIVPSIPCEPTDVVLSDVITCQATYAKSTTLT